MSSVLPGEDQSLVSIVAGMGRSSDVHTTSRGVRHVPSPDRETVNLQWFAEKHIHRPRAGPPPVFHGSAQSLHVTAYRIHTIAPTACASPKRDHAGSLRPRRSVGAMQQL